MASTTQGRESPAQTAHQWLRVTWGEHGLGPKAVEGPKDPRGAVEICSLLKLTVLIARHNPRIYTSVTPLCSNTRPNIQLPSHLFKFSKLLGYFSTVVHCVRPLSTLTKGQNSASLLLDLT